MLKDVLQKMWKGATDIDSIARELGVGRGTLDAILEMAVREGYLEKTNVALNCGVCSLRSGCKVKSPEGEKIEMYLLTQKGEKYACDKNE